MIARECNHCQSMYQAKPSELNRGQGLYCSRRCGGLARGKRHSTPNTLCSYCKEEFYRKPSSKRAKSGLYFCNSACQSSAYKDPNINICSGPISTGKRTKKTPCKICGLERHSNYNICKSCKKLECLKTWLAGDISVTWSGPYKETKSFVKEHLKTVRGDKCENCSFDKKSPSGNSIIQLEHIDGNYQNNAIENLQLLCPNCHAMTETYGNKNKNGGRKYRKKYYTI